MVRQLIMVLTCSNCLMTNCPRMPHSISFLRLKLSLTSTLTANRPKTAPDAPREMVALGCNKYDATLAPARAQNVNHGATVWHLALVKHAAPSSLLMQQKTVMYGYGMQATTRRVAVQVSPTAVMMYVNQTPHIPSSSSTILPKTYSRKVLLERCAHDAWQKLLVRNCHHRGAR